MKFNNILKGIAAFAIATFAFASCQKEEKKEADSLSVEPKSAITFKATGNEDITLKVTTNVDEWKFTAPEWIEAEMSGDKLIVNAKDNKADERLGRITISAGAAEPVKISVTQLAAGDTEPEQPQGGIVVTFNQATEQDMIYLGAELQTTVKANISIAEAVSQDVTVDVVFDESYLSEFNYNQGAEYLLFPKDKATYSATLTIKAGQTKSDDMEIKIDGSTLGFGSGYLVPFRVAAKEGSEVTVDRKNNRVNYVVMRQNPRTIKNVVYFEVNDVNPLNALEYVLADGTPFFDAVILFAANINYNSVEDRVYLHNNANVQALLDESEVYIQPLRKKGIKVYLGLLGNHDAAGLCQLSDWGCHEWAKEVAQAVKDYKLDGVNLDDEYSGGIIQGNPWFTKHGAKAGSQLMLELKLAMKEACYWPTEVSYFEWGALYNATNAQAWNPEVDEKGGSASGQEYTPGLFVDFFVANYGSSTDPYSDVGIDKCSGASLQCNYGASMTESQARDIKDRGFGWCMWFAFDPSGTGSISSNLGTSFGAMSAAAKGFYDQELERPTGVYNKIGEGEYDPERHDLKFEE